MVDLNNAKQVIRLREHKLKAKLNTLYATKLDAITARMYADDANIRRGALSAPRSQYRPGQRDDAVQCQLTRYMPAL